MTASDERSPIGWRERPLLLAALGAAAALAVWALTDRDWRGGQPLPPLAIWRSALALALAVAAFGFGFTAERVRLAWSAGFAAAVGVLAGLIFWWNGEPGHAAGDWIWDWRSASLLLAIAIAAPLFQTARDEGAARWPYAEVHAQAWTNVVLWFACWGFTGVTLLLTALLSQLFLLIGLHFLQELMQHGWFDAVLIGAAFGGRLACFGSASGSCDCCSSW